MNDNEKAEVIRKYYSNEELPDNPEVVDVLCDALVQLNKMMCGNALIPREHWKADIENGIKKKKMEQLITSYRNLHNDIANYLTPDKINDLPGFLQFEANRLITEHEKNLKPKKSLAEYLREKQKRDSERDPNELLGYPLSLFKQIAEKTDGIQSGFYVIGGYTNVGKTAFLSNLFYDLLITNKETTGIYFSLDDNKDIIINRFLGIKTGINLNEIQKNQRDSKNEKTLLDAYDFLCNLIDKGRLDIQDISEINNMDKLTLEIKKKLNTNKNLFVAIDGLHNLEVNINKRYGGIREENIEKANKIKVLVDTFMIPILATVELRKRTSGSDPEKKPTLDDIMESGKFAYNSNLVWLLSQAEGCDLTIKLDFKKNKLSSFKGDFRLAFIPETGKVKELDKNRW
jgi:hypothetical protein